MNPAHHFAPSAYQSFAQASNHEGSWKIGGRFFTRQPVQSRQGDSGRLTTYSSALG